MRLPGGTSRAQTPQISGRTWALVIKRLMFAFAIVGAHKLAKRIKSIVGNSPRPHELPQRVNGVAGETSTACAVNFGKEGCPLPGEKFSNFFGAFGMRRHIRHDLAG